MFWSNVAHAGTAMAPPQASSFAANWDALYAFINYASIISCILLIGGMMYFGFKYRRRTDNDKTAYIPHNAFLEFLWSFIPFVIFMVVFAWGWVVYNDMRNMPENGLEVHVFGQKWEWDFRYKSGRKSTNELFVPVNEDVKLIMTSRDVIHSFFVPAFRIKQDVVPGTYTALWFRATKLGSFNLFCTEFCGDGHSRMIGKVNVLSKADYEKWLQDDPTRGLSPIEIGKKIFNTKCMICHKLSNERAVGPGMAGLWGSERTFEGGGSATADENYIRESLLNPGAKIVKGYPAGMTPQQLNDDEILAIIELLKTLK